MWLLCLSFCLAITQAKIYNHLFETLLGRYNRLVRPAVDANDTIRIEFKLKLSQIVDVHAKHQTLTANGWLIHHWYDHRLSWKPEDYGGIKNFYVPGEIIWLPDIILYNNAHGSPWVSAITKAHVYYDGRVLLSDDVKYVVRKNESEWDVERGVDVSAFQESVEWDLLSVLGTRHEKWYPCCAIIRHISELMQHAWRVSSKVDQHRVLNPSITSRKMFIYVPGSSRSIDITYYLQIRRKKLFYTVHLIVPCASLAALTSWVFYLPCESHQKVQLCISVLVSLTVFFLLLVEIIPPTSIVLPLIVKYLTFTMFMVSLSVALTVFVIIMQFRCKTFTFVPPIFPISDRIRRIFIDTLGRKLLLVRATEEANFHRKAQHSKQISALSAMSILQKQFHKTVFEIEMATKAKKPMSTVNSLFLELPMMNRSMSVKPAAGASPSKLNKYDSYSID
ncbi:acetylcholine receptor subunit alpha-type unc-38 family protein [Ostertagia ostertagi]